MKTKRKNKHDCKHCTNAIFDEVWGDYKCKILKRVLKETDDANHCVYYKKGDAAMSAESREDDSQ